MVDWVDGGGFITRTGSWVVDNALSSDSDGGGGRIYVSSWLSKAPRLSAPAERNDYGAFLLQDCAHTFRAP